MATLVQLMDTLRSPRGCPWDREQTHETLRPFLLEESAPGIPPFGLGLRPMAGRPGRVRDSLLGLISKAFDATV